VNPAALLRTVGLVKAFHGEGGPVHALRGVDLSLEAGEFVAVMGPSGSGKSTLLHTVGGLEPATRGEIWLDGNRVDRLSQAQWAMLRRRYIGFVFQSFNLVSTMTVADNVELAALLGGAARREARKRREELLGELGLSAKAGAAPTRNLDSSNSADVLRMLGRFHRRGQAILLVTHDARAASMADRVISLFDGMVADDAAIRPPLGPPTAAAGVLRLSG
jgi:putative ABC transport system ATP-binding protein